MTGASIHDECIVTCDAPDMGSCSVYAPPITNNNDMKGGGGAMEKIYEVTCSTKRFEGDDAVQTTLELDFSKLTDADILQMAVDSAVIKWQSAARRAALKKVNPVAIPKEATYEVQRPGTRATGEVSMDKAFERIVKAFSGDMDKAIQFLREKSNNKA